MAKTEDFTKYMTDMMGAFPVDTAAFEDALQTWSSWFLALALDPVPHSSFWGLKGSLENSKTVMLHCFPLDVHDTHALVTS